MRIERTYRMIIETQDRRNPELLAAHLQTMRNASMCAMANQKLFETILEIAEEKTATD